MGILSWRQPLSIKAIVLYYLVIDLPFAASWVRKQTIIFLWWTFIGNAALYVSLLHVALLVYLSFGLWKLHEMARRLAIAYACLGILFVWMDILLTSNWAEVTKVYARYGIATPPSFFIFAGIMLTVPSVIVLWFLIKRKSAFAKPISQP